MAAKSMGWAAARAPALPGSPPAQRSSTVLKPPPRRAAGDAAEDDGEPGRAEVDSGGAGAEIGVVADQGQGAHAGDDDGGEHGAAGAGLEGVAELLDGEDDAGERSVEGGGDPGGAPGEDEGTFQLGPWQVEEFPQGVQEGGADLDGGPSRPMEAPLSRPSRVSRILPAAMRSERCGR